MKWGFVDLSELLVQAGSRLQCLRWNGCVVQSTWRNQPGWTERQLQSDSSTACHHCLCSCSRSILVHNSLVVPCQGRDLIYLNWNISKSTELAGHPDAIFPLVGMQYEVPGCPCSSWSRVDKLCCTHTDASSVTRMALRNRLLSQVWSKYIELTSKTRSELVKVLVGKHPAENSERTRVDMMALVILYTSVTFRLLLLRNFEGFMLCWQYDCYSVLFLFGSSFSCLGEIASRNNHGNHINVSWKGPLKITYSSLPLNQDYHQHWIWASMSLSRASV